MLIFKWWIAIFVIAFSNLCLAVGSDYDHCVFKLHNMGGIAKLTSADLCFDRPTANSLNCQNQKFLNSFVEPITAYKQCLVSSEVINPEQTLPYRGSFEAPVLDKNKKTVCSVTINSAEEKEAFKSSLNPNHYQWVELLPYNTPENRHRFIVRDNHWLNYVIQKNLTCDILVFSGHFASSFIGDTGFEVSLDDLNNASCKPENRKFFNSVKQVYLFGCNTLATKKADRRSIEQYINILIDDGVLAHQAQRIAARRYTAYDQSIRDEFRRVFPKAEYIFGYDQQGPTGKQVKPILEKFIRLAYSTTDSATNTLYGLSKVLINSFNQTLARTGMLVTTGLEKNNLSCSDQSQKNIGINIQSKAELDSYIVTYSQKIPVAVLDLVFEFYSKKLITSDEFTHFISKSLQLIKRLPIKARGQIFCPILGTEHARHFTEELNLLNCQDKVWMFKK